jgi:hypothetical protein
MDSMTRGVLILLTVLIIGGTCATLIYFQDDIFGPRYTTTTQVTTETTGEATMPAEDQTYIQTLNSYDSSLIAAVSTINSLLVNPLIDNQGWANSMAVPVGNVLGLYNVIAQIPASTTITMQMHYYYVNNVAGNYYTAVQFITAAISEGKTESLAYANAYIEAATQARANFFNQLNEYVNSFN